MPPEKMLGNGGDDPASEFGGNLRPMFSGEFMSVQGGYLNFLGKNGGVAMEQT